MRGTLELLFRYRPGHKPDIDRLLSSIQQVWSANEVAITCTAGADAAVSSPLMESLSVNGCSGGAIGDHRRLFDLAADISSPDQIVVFVVRRIADGLPFSGCAVHPPATPGLLLTEDAAAGTITSHGRWVLAHEIGHVLGLSHVPSSGSLMCDPATSISATTPALSPSERQSVMNSGRVGQSGSLLRGGRAFSGLPSRTTPDRTIPARELPILENPRHTLLDDLD